MASPLEANPRRPRAGHCAGQDFPRLVSYRAWKVLTCGLTARSQPEATKGGALRRSRLPKAGIRRPSRPSVPPESLVIGPTSPERARGDLLGPGARVVCEIPHCSDPVEGLIVHGCPKGRERTRYPPSPRVPQDCPHLRVGDTTCGGRNQW